jgi:retron-type reverse transcriptase
MHRKVLNYKYEDLISLNNLLEAWQVFLKGKRSRADVQVFERNLMHSLISLHEDLATMRYMHDPYEGFTVSDPKHRQIHKASVRDRVLHRTVYDAVYPFFDRLFIPDSYACRKGKGVHKALTQFTVYTRKVSQNYRKTAWVLKCDIRQFFASIDQNILLSMLADRITDQRILCLVESILGSFYSGYPGKGLPLGNLTSQIFANIYMNEFDQFVKHTLRARYYIRYADDFVFMSPDKTSLQQLIPDVKDFLSRILRLKLHPNKIELRTVASGVDFLGWIHFPHHRVLRTTTKRRMMKRMQAQAMKGALASYKGLLSHGNEYKVSRVIEFHQEKIRNKNRTNKSG